jgi:DNA polymerase-3 subunit delta'
MSLAEFSTQENVVALLQRSLERGRLGHAYLFTGTDLAELEAVGLALAQTLNCQESPQVAPDGTPLDACGACASCRKIANTNHADVMVIRPESKLRQIKIEQMVRRTGSPPRVLHDLVNNKATEGLYKVALLVAADRMNANAANSLLKSLEEPPERTVFILLSTEPERLLDTIHSRCLRLTFAGDGRARFGEDEQAWLGEFARMAAEGKKDCFGRYRLLGTLMARLEEMKSVIETEVEEASPLHDHDEADPELREQWENECKAAASAEYRLRRAGYLGALQGWLRDVWLHSAGVSSVNGDLALFPNLDYTAEAVAERLSPADAAANLRLMEQTQRTLHTNVQELVALETGLLKLKL